jgi:hypothetical protein
MHTLILTLILLFPRGAQQDPVILMSSDLDQVMNFFDLPPEGAPGASGWLGLYVGPEGWRLEEAQVDIALREEDGRLDFEITAVPAGAELRLCRTSARRRSNRSS